MAYIKDYLSVKSIDGFEGIFYKKIFTMKKTERSF